MGLCTTRPFKKIAVIVIMGGLVVALPIGSRNNVEIHEKTLLGVPTVEKTALELKAESLIAEHGKHFDSFLSKLQKISYAGFGASYVLNCLGADPAMLAGVKVLRRFFDNNNSGLKDKAMRVMKKEEHVQFVASFIRDFEQTDGSFSALEALLHKKHLALLGLDHNLSLIGLIKKIEEKSNNSGDYSVSNDLYFKNMTLILFVSHLWWAGAFKNLPHK